MIRIAICDDEQNICELLQEYLKKFSTQYHIELSYDIYNDGNDLIQMNYSSYDLLILDVQMRTSNGIEIARQIRASGCDMTIIFFTNYVQYALEGYEVQAFRFLLKPLTYERFSEVVGAALLQIQSQRQECLNVRLRDSVLRVVIAEISYAETEHGHVVLHTTAHETIVCYSPMKEIEQLLADHLFFRCHTAYLVNMAEIRTVGTQDVILRDGTTLPVSKHRKKVLREALTLYWGDQFL